jgi:hypothetical protein
LTFDDEALNAARNERRLKIGGAFIIALAAMPEPAATHSLAQHAVLSPHASVRIQATDRLRYRSPHDFVPMLLDALAMPIESSYSIARSPDGSVRYTHSLYRVGLNAEWSVESLTTARQRVFGAPRPIESPQEVQSPRIARNSWRLGHIIQSKADELHREFAQNAEAVQQRVEKENASTDALNQRVTEVLAQVTSQDLGRDPRKWWDWWTNYNDYYVPEDRPVYEWSKVASCDYFHPAPAMMSCFAKDTAVWTKTGQQPIETIELGDLVLAQDVNTGELAYKPVLGRTVRPPSAIVKLSFGGEQIMTTRGHPFWVPGVGWRMAKELGDGAILHGVTGAARIASVGETEQAEAYNLVVADFNTYFVGEGGILVHDNTPRRPTRATIPGVAAR